MNQGTTLQRQLYTTHPHPHIVTYLDYFYYSHYSCHHYDYECTTIQRRISRGLHHEQSAELHVNARTHARTQ